MYESGEHQESACKRRKLSSEEDDEMLQHSSKPRLELSDLNTQIFTKAEPKQEKHDPSEQPDAVKHHLTSEQIKGNTFMKINND